MFAKTTVYVFPDKDFLWSCELWLDIFEDGRSSTNPFRGSEGDWLDVGKVSLCCFTQPWPWSFLYFMLTLNQPLGSLFYHLVKWTSQLTGQNQTMTLEVFAVLNTIIHRVNHLLCFLLLNYIPWSLKLWLVSKLPFSLELKLFCISSTSTFAPLHLLPPSSSTPPGWQPEPQISEAPPDKAPWGVRRLV